MFDVKILTSRPHSEDDILSKRPIRWKIGDVEMTFPIFSYKNYVDFDKAMRVLLAQSLIGETYPSDEQFRDTLTRIYGQNPELYLLDNMEIDGSKVPLLPAYIMKFASFQNIKDFCIKYNTWKDSEIISDNSPEIELHLAKIDYLISNCFVFDLYKLFKDLLWLQYNIKKKVLELLKEEEEPENEALKPQSSATVIAWESIRKKRLKRRLMSTS